MCHSHLPVFAEEETPVFTLMGGGLLLVTTVTRLVRV